MYIQILLSNSMSAHYYVKGNAYIQVAKECKKIAFQCLQWRDPSHKVKKKRSTICIIALSYVGFTVLFVKTSASPWVFLCRLKCDWYSDRYVCRDVTPSSVQRPLLLGLRHCRYIYIYIYVYTSDPFVCLDLSVIGIGAVACQSVVGL